MTRLRVSLPGALITAALSLTVLNACSSKVDRVTIDRVIGRGMAVEDVDKVCELGVSLVHGLRAVGPDSKPPALSLVIAEAAAGLCDDARAWEAELTGLRARENMPPGAQQVAEVRDARILQRRHHQRAAARFQRSFETLEQHYGTIGEGECPRIAPRDEVAYLLGLLGGCLALLHDTRGGATVGVPMSQFGKVARGAECLDNERWWYMPQALQGVAWATVPGLAPEGTDPWAHLQDAAARGAPSGVRTASALYIVAAGNGGRTELLEQAIRDHAASLASTPTSPDGAFFDEYGRLVAQHESDRLWMQARGHRTPNYGELPSDEADPSSDTIPGGDPFGGVSPFDQDPFGDASTPDAPTDDAPPDHAGEQP